MFESVVYKGVKVNYCKFGEGETTLFLHGWEGEINSFLWFAKRLDGCKVLVDLPPFGKSELLKGAWNLFDYVSLIKYLMAHLQIEKYNIVAHSFGGRIALVLGTSKNVNKMVLTGSAGIKDKSIITKLKVAKFKILKQLAHVGLYDKKKLLKYGSSDYIKLDDIMKQTFKNVVNLDLKSILKYVQCETLLVWGENDNSTPLKNGKLMKKKLANSGLYIIKGGSHFAYIEYPQIFLSAIKEFFNL